MSDEQRHDDSDPAAGGSGPGSPPPDETAPMPVHRTDSPAPGDEPTTVLPSGGRRDDDATTVLPSGGAPGDEATTVLPSGGRDDEATTVLPAGGRDEAASTLPWGSVAGSPEGQPASAPPSVGERPEPPNERTSVMPAQDIWTGRAGVPERESAPMRDATPPPGVEYGEGQRTWRAPLIIIAIALLLLALFGVGAWFALRGSGPTPAPSASPTPALTSAAPSSAAPSPSVSVSASVSTATVPTNLVGMSQQEAIDALNAVGLNPEISLRPTDDADPGTVVEVKPDGGSVVKIGETVTIVVASASASSPPPPSPSPEPVPSPEESPSPDGDDD
ncbi:hypothetical protein Cme02nite_25240 [Catellatospora methionotrophica]|uniref:PASTA domain-containing protein n=1 Tax=Catellatospora methionotrophica TaxID=121620 RepID=A0A8J3PEI8_9ACTN|nr:PASTA domain-containing protein [Catellatospora methionotrophica]GIG14192.1 hypothetical protein Cme02nite_25240 [Catellatospora methionotrophica]